MSTFTPGPWEPNGFAIEAPQPKGCFVIAHCYHDNDEFVDQGIDEATAEANARLIAAAPKMLAALKAVHPFLEELELTDYNLTEEEDPVVAPVLAMVEDAIERAEGRR